VSGLRFDDEQVAATGRWVAIAIFLSAVVFNLDWLASRSLGFTGGHFWGSVYTLLPALISGCLLLATVALLVEERRRPEWAPRIALVGLAGALALALKAADEPVVWGRLDEGFWGALFALVTLAFYPLLLALPLRDRARPLGGPSAWGVVAGVALMAGGIVLGLHAASDARYSGFWSFIDSGLVPVSLGALLVLTSSPAETSSRTLRGAAGVVAALVVILGASYAVDFVDRFPINAEWYLLLYITPKVSLALLVLSALGVMRRQPAIVLAVAVGVSTVAFTTWLMTTGDTTFQASFYFSAIASALAIPALAVMCAAITEGERAGDQSWAASSSSSAWL
jgi:hypothetical protein